MGKARNVKEAINNTSNDGKFHVQMNEPYRVEVAIVGTAPILFHRYSVEDVIAKGNAKKGSAQKKTDNVESYVYRDDLEEGE